MNEAQNEQFLLLTGSTIISTFIFQNHYEFSSRKRMSLLSRFLPALSHFIFLKKILSLSPMLHIVRYLEATQKNNKNSNEKVQDKLNILFSKKKNVPLTFFIHKMVFNLFLYLLAFLLWYFSFSCKELSLFQPFSCVSLFFRNNRKLLKKQFKIKRKTFFPYSVDFFPFPYLLFSFLITFSFTLLWNQREK